MTGLLPQNLLEDLVRDTSLPEGPSRLVRTVARYKPFTVTQKRADVDLRQIEKMLEEWTARLDQDWKSFYLKDAVLTRTPGAIMPLRKSRLAKDSVCCLFELTDSALPLVVFFEPKTLYLILAKYFGSGDVMGSKKTQVVTDVETRFLTTVLKGVQESFSGVFGKVAISLKKLNAEPQDQRESLKADHVVTDFSLQIFQEDFRFAAGIPVMFLQALQASLSGKASAGAEEKDPAWQNALVRVVSDASVQVSIRLGQMEIPFSKSVELQVGDILPWHQSGGSTNVEISFLGQLRMLGVVGTVGENYAIQVTRVV